MDKKKKAIEELQKQIKLGRERLGPEGVRELEKLAQNLKAPKTGSALPPDSVPYDKKAAMAAFQFFLKNHGDPEEFERRLKAMINKESH
jgi:hypothetical protein